jgi:YD repeat-containing protein
VGKGWQYDAYSYDPQGNILNEYRSGAGGQEKYDYTHTYDALNRLTKTTGLWGYKEHTYEYDSLGNLVYEKNILIIVKDC